jgi:hypothetical protein
LFELLIDKELGLIGCHNSRKIYCRERERERKKEK